MVEKPSVLIIGGLGYIGRFLALHIHENQLASEIRIVDKALPELAWLAPEFEEVYSKENFVQADASKSMFIPKIFNRKNGKEWDFVFNCAGETRYSQDDEVYRIRSLELSVMMGEEAAKRGVQVFVELSTGMVYKPTPKPKDEDGELKPYSKIAGFELQAEQKLKKIEGLNLVIARLAYVYGDYAPQFVGTALSLARVYQYLDEEMRWLWTKDLKSNTVHVIDVTRALWSMADWYAVQKKPRWNEQTMGKTPVFNVVDKGDTSQGTIAEIIGQIFGIKTSFEGKSISRFACLNKGRIVDELNDKVLGPWNELLEKSGIINPGPITPFMEKELLKDVDLTINGDRLERIIGFKFNYPQVNVELLQSTINSYKRMNWWPI